MARGRGSNQGMLLLVLLALIGGFGTWNYQRNVKAEESVVRPYRGYSEVDLETLAGAYQQELDDFNRRYETSAGSRARVVGGQGVGAKVRDFERVQRLSRQTRDLYARIAEREASLAEIEREQGRREIEKQKLTLFLKRAFVYRG